jgi:hypothetical protein
MAVNPKCNDPTDTFANIYYSRGTFVVYATNPFPIAQIATQLATLKGIGSIPLVVVTSGLNGDTAYAADGFQSYLNQYGQGKPWPASMGGQPVGDIDDDGTRTCNPGPCPTGSHWDFDANGCVPDTPTTTPPPSSGGGGDTTDPRPDWPIDTITVSIDSLDETFVVADQSTEVLKYLIRLWDLQHGITPPAKLKPPPGQPPPIIKPLPGKKCKAGYTYNKQLEMCVIDPTPPPPPPPPPPPVTQPGGGPGPDPDGDEITNDLCAQLQGYFNALTCAIAGMAPAGAPSSDCCDAVVTAIGDVTAQLSRVIAALPVAPDLTSIVTALDTIATALASRAPASVTIDTTPIADALKPLADAIASSPATDVSGIVQQLAAIVGQGDVDQATIDALVAAGLLSASDGQTLQGIKWSDAISFIIGAAPVRAVEHFVKAVGADAETIGAEAVAAAGAGVTWVEQKVAAGITLERNVVLDVLQPILQSVLSAVTPASTPAIGQAGVDGDTVIADVATVMLNIKLLAMLLSMLREGAGEQLSNIGEKVLGLLGFEELREVQLGPLVKNGLAKVADMNAKALFQQDIPGVGQITNMVARGIMPAAQAAALLGYNGLHFALQPLVQTAAYRGLAPRQLLRLIESNLFTQGDILDELNFAGVRQASQQRMLTAAPWLATTSQRAQLKSALENEYTNGLISDSDLSQQLAQLEQNTDGDAMTLQRVQIEKLIAFCKNLERAYSKQFVAGLIDATAYQSNLAGIGLQADWINNRIAADTADVSAVQFKKQLAAELALERTTAAEERKAAVKNFTSGNTDEAGLLAALLLSGLNATQAAAWTDLAALQKSGGLRWTYGLQLPPIPAALLRQRVAALVDQRKSGLIQDPGFAAALSALGIPSQFVNAIMAAADALVKPLTSAVYLNVGTG